MKAWRIALVLLCFAFGPASAQSDSNAAPAATSAQSDPSAPPVAASMGAISFHVSADMQRVRAQAQQSQLMMRQSILSVLSPAQRALVASTIGQLAIAPNPDRLAAARQIDATLYPAQRQAISTSVLEAFDREQAAFAQMAAQADVQFRALQSSSQANQSTAQPLIAGQLDAVRAQMHNWFLQAMRNQTAGSIVITALSSPDRPVTGLFPGTIVMGTGPVLAPPLAPSIPGPLPAAPLPAPTR